MYKKAGALHWILLIAGWVGLVWQLIFFLVHWGSLPEEPGIHFDRGDFDVYASKVYGFYPHLISLIVLAANTLLTFVVGREKLKLGLKVSEKGKRLIISSMVIDLDIVALLIVLIFCCWTYAVSVQDPGVMMMSGDLFSVALTFATLGAMFQCVVARIYRDKGSDQQDLSPKEKRKQRLRFLLTGSSDKMDSGKFRRLSRAVSWIIVVMLTPIFLFCLERLPKDDLADLHHGQAWFEDLGGYYDKWMLFLPFIIAVPIMLLCEVGSVKAVKKGCAPLAKLFDSIKLLLAVFSGWCELMLFSEQGIHPAVYIICVAFCLAATVRYFVERRRTNENTSADS